MKQHYLALLRGINISGKNIIKMSELTEVLISAGFENVKTVLNSGNILFTAEEANYQQTIQKLIKEKFDLTVPVHILTIDQLKILIAKAPDWWGKGGEFYDNLIFLLADISPSEAVMMLGSLNDKLEKAEIAKIVIYWSFILKDYRHSKWWHMTANSPIKDYLTIRTAKTLRKILKESEKL